MKKVVFLFCLLLFLTLPAGAQTEQSGNLGMAKNMDIFNAICRNLDMMYVDTVDADKVVTRGINSMLQSLDPYTVYYHDASDLRQFITGKYAGIGALIRYHMKLGTAVIDEPYGDTPSSEAGLRKGDIILSIDDSTMMGKDTRYVSSHLRGDAGTTFLLKFRRPSTGKEMKAKITRRTIKQMPTIPYYGLRENGIGYISLSQFTEGCSQEVRNAFIELKEKGMTRLVLDLRNNGGGSELEAANLVNIFVPRGITVAQNRGKMARANHDYVTTVEPLDTLMPVVVLVNGDTASSSEIVSGALQDLDRAVIVGTRTYGKGLVQLPMDLPYNAQLKMTTGKYHIPSGRCIQAINYKDHNAFYSEHIPDSLTRVFHTKNGREVRDGGGIQPDVEIKADSLPNIAYYLSNSGMDSTEVMFDYEVDYLAAHPVIAKPSEFEISDDDYAEFKRRVLEAGFKYDPQSEKVMKRLKEIMAFEGYLDDAQQEFEALEQKLTHNLERDLERHKEALKIVLSSDIVAAHYYQGGALEYSLKHDKQMDEACRLLTEEAEYNRLLQPQK